MFGDNPTLGVEDREDGVVEVQEVFETIQGEGPDAGTPATFIRLYGCHLHCYFCDTDFMSARTPHTVDQLCAKCTHALNQLVVLTGGEPMRQNIAPLVKALLLRGHRVQIETAGSFWFRNLSPDDLTRLVFHPHLSFVVSPKTPAVHKSIARKATAWKYVVSASGKRDPYDGLPVVNYQEREGGTEHKLARPPVSTPPREVFVQPMDELNAQKNADNRALCADLAMTYGYRVSLQQHKLLGLP